MLQGRAVGLVWGRVPAARSSGGAAASERSLGRAARSSGPRGVCGSWVCRSRVLRELLVNRGKRTFCSAT